MNEKFDFKSSGERIVYVRPVDVAELPGEVQAQVGSTEGTIYALHGEDGERLALVRDRRMAFIIARQHDMAPVSVN